MLALIDGDVQVFWAAASTDSPGDTEEKLHEVFQESLEGSFATDYKLAVKGKGNYRKDYYPFYKSKRKPLEADMKERLSVAHSILVKEYGAVMANGMEADDYVRIWAEESRAAGQPFVVVAEDKDLKCIPGAHYNPKKNEIFHMSEDEADLWYHIQLLAGDSTDDIPGLWRVGVKNKFLDEVPMGERMDKVIEIYKEKEGDNWYVKLMETGTLIHILKSKEDFFYVPKVSSSL